MESLRGLDEEKYLHNGGLLF